MNLPRWLRLSLILPLLGLNLFVLRQLLLRLAPFPALFISCLLYTSPSPRDATLSRMPSSA